MTEYPPGLDIFDPGTDTPVESRVEDGASARGLVFGMIKEDERRNYNRALVKGMVDGNAPYSIQKQITNKLQWTANINFGQGQALMDQTATPYYAIFNGVENYAECRTAFGPDDPNYEWWNERISLRFHQLLRRWIQFDWHMQQISYWMRLHGIGPVFWDKDGDWRFRSMPTGNFLCAQGTPSVIDERHPQIVMRVAYRIHELFDKIRDEEAATAAGWNVEYVKNVIRYAGRGMNPNAQWWAAPWEYWQRRLKDNDLYYSYTMADIVYCSYLFVRELNGKITKMLVTEGGIPAPGAQATPNSKDSEFMLRQPDRYDEYSECIQAFFLSANDGSFHSVRGYGTASFKYFELSNRILCRAADGVFIKGSLVLQPGTAKNSDKLQLTQHGPVTWIPAGAELKQLQMQGATDELLAFHRVLSNQFASNLGVNGGQPLSRTDGRGEVPTAEQIRAQVSNDATISQGQMTLFYLQLDTLYAEVFRRVVWESDDDESKRFLMECQQDGVPPEALKDMEFVRANRASGYGSPAMRQQTDQQMMQFLPMLPEEGRQAFLEDAVAGIKGAEKVRRYVPKQHIPNNDDWQASVENDVMNDGREPILASGQDDVIHLNSHLQDAANTLAPAQQAMDQGQNLPPDQLQKLYQYVQILSNHCEAHLARLQRDPTRKGLVSMFQQQLAHLVSFSGKLRSAYIRAVKDQQLQLAQQQQATTLNALDQAKLQSTQVDNAMKVAKTQTTIKTTNAKALNSMRIATLKAGQDVVIKHQQHQQDMEMASAE